ncbi:YciI family protein [Bowmanella dokdonensis]|uniref:YciI family protein n=1 Tax=Bowmanella dokdonensis TaxID=751969 RepID=A0A939DRE1_9ALTE|nr:YciI family protein [Bowmanella dokdonensis]MBN7827583.1 YciI family protein [Bowmanella dokdonensis]
MKYLLMIYTDEKLDAQQDEERLMTRYNQLISELEKEGVYLSGERLSPVETATTVQMRDGNRLVSDGPFAETREQLGGFFLVDCRDLDHAMEVAGRIPSAEIGSIEIRPLWFQEE